MGDDGTNRAAIGARVEVATDEVEQTQHVDGGHVQRDLVLHFGLGAACEATVTVSWPGGEGTTPTFTVAPNARYEVVQGSAPRRVR